MSHLSYEVAQLETEVRELEKENAVLELKVEELTRHTEALKLRVAQLGLEFGRKLILEDK